MKKIVCLLLVLVCSFAMFSCFNSGKSDVDTISKIVNESVATKIVTKVDYVPVDDEALSGVYTTSIDRNSGKSKFTFVYSRYATVEEMNGGHTKTVDGSVWYDANGQISRNEGDTWEPNLAPAYLPNSLDISEARFVSVALSEDGTDMTAEIAPKEAKRAFGTDISAEGNIVLKVETNGTYLYEISVTYTAKDTGALVTVVTSYDYGEVEFDFGIDVGTDDSTEDNVDDSADTAE